MKTILFIFCAFILCFVVDSNDQISNEYAVEMDMDKLEANLDLNAYNLEVIRQVSSLGNVFHLKHHHDCNNDRCKRSVSESISDMLRQHPLIRRVEQQVDLEVEQKSDSEFFFDDKDLDGNDQKKSFDDDGSRYFDTLLDIEKKEVATVDSDYWVHDLTHTEYPIDNVNSDLRKKSIESELPDLSYDLTEDDKYYLKLVEERRDRVKSIHFNDPEAGNLWQYNNYGQFDRMNPGMDMNLYQVYLANYSGKGVVVTVIDDGLDTHHIEIARNYDPAASLDFNDPHSVKSSPRGPNESKNMPFIEGHGTECAGVIGGVANNSFCAHGVAFNVNLGGIRMLARNMVTDLLEAYALTHNNQYIDIYSNSWGPKDSGAKTSPVTFYVNKAFETGIAKGRQGKGSLFLFAAGNGGLKYDNCGADGLVNSPYTIAVTAINIHGMKPAYTEECSAITITAAVGGYSYDQMYERDDIDPVLIAAQVNGKCAKRFLGTSAATPMISGCMALALEANNELTWRDIQHLMTISGRIPNAKETVWQLNTEGFLTSHHYGFGLLDCSALVYNAQRWVNVGPHRRCIAGKTSELDDLIIRRKKRTRLTFQTKACKFTKNAVETLEHVRVHTKIKHPCRGDLAIILTSPTGTRSFLLKTRKWDDNNSTIAFSHLSMMNWGEHPIGTWHLDFIDIGHCKSDRKTDDPVGSIIEASLEFYGTKKSESAISKNGKLINEYFKNINLIKPTKSIILNERELYDFYNDQRKYFIRIIPSQRQNQFDTDKKTKTDQFDKKRHS